MTNTAAARPTGLTILAVLAAISGAISLFTSLGFLAGAPLIEGVVVGTDFSGVVDALKAVAVVVGVFWLVIGVAQLAFAFGAWTLKPWGWFLGMVIEGASIILTVIIGVMVGNLAGTLIASAVPLAIAIIVIWYLNTARVKAAFGRS